MRRFIEILSVVVFLSASCRAQQRHELTLDQSIAMAVEKGFIASSVKARYLSALKNAESAQRSLWTSMNLQLNTPEFLESLTQQFNPITGLYEYYQLKSTSFQSLLSINQPIVYTGGTLRFSQSLFSRDQTSGISGSTRQWKDYLSNFYVEFQQPILTPNIHGINQTRNQIAIEQSGTDFLRDQLDLVYSVTESFYLMYQTSQRTIIVRTQMEQNEESYTTAKRKYEAGLIPEVEVLQSDVDLSSSRNDLLNTERELARAKNAFRLLVGIPTADEVEAVGDIQYRPVIIDENRAVESALANRSEVLSAERQVQLAEGNVGLARSQNDFRLDLTARYGLSKNSEEFQNTFNDFNRTRGALLSVSIPIFDWGSHSLSVEAAQVQQTNAVDAVAYTRQQVRQEILDLVNRIRVAESRIQVLEKAVEVAQKGYDISLQRFGNGAITRNDLALTQQRLTTAKTNSLNALIDYKLGLADLQRKTLYDFERQEPVRPVMVPEE